MFLSSLDCYHLRLFWCCGLLNTVQIYHTTYCITNLSWKIKSNWSSVRKRLMAVFFKPCLVCRIYMFIEVEPCRDLPGVTRGMQTETPLVTLGHSHTLHQCSNLSECIKDFSSFLAVCFFLLWIFECSTGLSHQFFILDDRQLLQPYDNFVLLRPAVGVKENTGREAANTSLTYLRWFECYKI